MLWDLNDDKHLYTLDHTDTINALCFSPNRYWLCAATGPSIKIWVSFQIKRNLINLIKVLEMGFFKFYINTQLEFLIYD